ncbi:MAG: hypothetical protein H5U02_07370 [Clostridia bacterium]|nr:hypothetical protein [Clostridia bacterium]
MGDTVRLPPILAMAIWFPGQLISGLIVPWASAERSVLLNTSTFLSERMIVYYGWILIIQWEHVPTPRCRIRVKYLETTVE